MNYKNESGHPQNLLNFGSIITICISYGDKYRPSPEFIKIPGLQSLLGQAKGSQTSVTDIIPAYKIAAVARKEAFAPLDKLVTRSLNAMATVCTSKQLIENARSLERKLHGRRSTPKMTEEEKQEAIKNGEVITEHSSSHTGYNARAENFEQFVKILAIVPQYQPNEPELKLESLKALSESLKAKNEAVNAAEVALKTAKIARHEILYNENEGLHACAKKVKGYVKSVFGATSPQYKQISGIRFTKPSGNNL